MLITADTRVLILFLPYPKERAHKSWPVLENQRKTFAKSVKHWKPWITNMEIKWILIPLFAQVLLTFYVGIVMRLRREKAVKEGTDWRYFKTFEGEKPPRYVLQADQHFTNMFETPMLFFAACISAMIFDTVDNILFGLASAFVLGRCIHAWITLTNNRLLWRGRIFVASCLALLAIWVWLIYSVFA